MLIYLAAAGVVVAIWRAAKNRGRQGWLWATWAAIAAVVGKIAGLVVLWRFAVSSNGDGVGDIMFGFLLSMAGPFVCMGVVLALLYWLPEGVPTVRGLKWAVHRMAKPGQPGVDSVLKVEHGVLEVADLRVDLKDLTDIAADGECLKLVWPTGSLLLLPTGEMSTAERGKHSQGLARRLQRLRSADLSRQG